MIQILINNEALDIDTGAVVTFKKAQALNGIQSQYSFSNNFNLKNSSKNRRLLGINYLPNSKAKSMTAGYDCDIVLNGCIFLKRQKLKVQKETDTGIPVYVIFTDSFLVAKAKEVLMNQVNLGASYTKSLGNFLVGNAPSFTTVRTAPISAQDQSGLIVVEEVPMLLNIKDLILKVFTQLGYAYSGDILTDINIDKYYTNSNVGIYGLDGTPTFEATMTCYDFILDFLETFNGYIEVSDSSKSLGLYFWKNIENIKSQFVDYSSKFTKFEEYTFEGGLAKVNTVAYSDSPDFYNGFFNNNKSIVDKSTYLTSNFGAGNLRLFADQDLEEDGTLLPRINGESTEPQTMNLFRFEDAATATPVYSNGFLTYHDMYKAFSPNILEIWQLFHQPYCANISLPTIAQLSFRYDALFLAGFKMSEVFFIKQLSTYWLPLELNFTTKKDGVKVKALMIEKTVVDSPVVFDQNLSVDFYGEVFILDIFALYAAYNVSPAATMLITAADLTKNDIYINGTQILAFPTSIDVSLVFEIRVENIEAENIKSNSDIKFKFISQEGGVSREATINVAHNGYANFLTAFRPADMAAEFNYGQDNTADFAVWFNQAQTIFTPINVPTTLNAALGSEGSQSAALNSFKITQSDRAQLLTIKFHADFLRYTCSNRGGKATARTKVTFEVWKNGAQAVILHSGGVVDRYKRSSGEASETDVNKTATLSVAAGDTIAFFGKVTGEKDRALDEDMDGRVYQRGVTWEFKCSEQL